MTPFATVVRNEAERAGRRSRPARRSAGLLLAGWMLAAAAGCGGGGGGAPAPAPPDPSPAPAPSPAPGAGGDDAARIAAAAAIASSPTNPCATIGPFYWEIGDADGVRASGTRTSAADPTVYARDTPMSIASASKWL